MGIIQRSPSKKEEQKAGGQEGRESRMLRCGKQIHMAALEPGNQGGELGSSGAVSSRSVFTVN